jgi:hypothetical protein
MTMIGIGSIGVILAMGLGLVISRGVTVPLAQGVKMMQEMNLGHLGRRGARCRRLRRGMSWGRSRRDVARMRAG